MSNLIAFPDPRGARESASLWLARLDRGLSPAERTEMRQWLKVPAHRRTLAGLARLWQNLDSMSVLAELFPLSAGGLDQPPRRSMRDMALAAFTAVCMVLLGMTMLSGEAPWNLYRGPQIVVETEGYGTAEGEVRTFPLRDGTSITLNSNSAVAVIYSAHAREVSLVRGEAFFDVAHDASRPFRVYAGQRALQAVGTAFNVRLMNPEQFVLTVTAGRVKLLPNANSDRQLDSLTAAHIRLLDTTVDEEEGAVVQPDTETVNHLDPAEVQARLAWRHSPRALPTR